MGALDWQDRAACKGRPANVFFLDKGQPATEAKAICATCPVRAECLDYAIEHSIKDGIFGGLNGNERHRVRKARLLAEAATQYCDEKGSAA